MIINHRALLAEFLVQPFRKKSWIPIRALGQLAGELAWVHSRETKYDAVNSSFDNFKTNLLVQPHWAICEDMIVIGSLCPERQDIVYCLMRNGLTKLSDLTQFNFRWLSFISGNPCEIFALLSDPKFVFGAI